MIDSYYETSRELARRKGVCESHARKLMREGRHPGIKAYNVWHAPREGDDTDGHAWPFESVREAAERFGVCATTIRTWCRDGVLEGYKVPGFRAWHIKRDALPVHVTGETSSI